MHEIRGRTFGTPFNVRGVISSFYVVQRIKSYELQCGTKFLLEFIFAGWRFFVFCGNLFLRLGQISFSCWELIFAIFRKYPVASQH